MTKTKAAPERASEPDPQAAAKRRARQTLNNLLLSLGASLGIVLVLILMVPRDDSNRIQPVDYKSVAADAASASSLPIIVPAKLTGWWANSARYTTTKAAADGVATWYVGFVGPVNQHLGVTQAFGINPTWLAFELKNSAKTGTVQVGDKTWDVYEAIEPSKPAKTKDYEMVLRVGNDVVLLYGTGSPKEFQLMAGRVNSEVAKLYK